MNDLKVNETSFKFIFMSNQQLTNDGDRQAVYLFLIASGNDKEKVHHETEWKKFTVNLKVVVIEAEKYSLEMESKFHENELIQLIQFSINNWEKWKGLKKASVHNH